LPEVYKAPTRGVGVRWALASESVAGGAQESGRRDSTSLSRRSPVDRLAFVSSPTISATDATSSAPPGGCTVLLERSLSHSNPCLGAGSTWATGRVGRGRALPERCPLADPRVLAPAPPRVLAEPRVPAGRLAVDVAVLGGLVETRPLELAGAALALVDSAAAAAVAARAAARRGLERCGRVRGRLDRTP